MNDGLFHSTTSERSRLLGIVLGLHVAVFALFPGPGARVPDAAEPPLRVDWIEAKATTPAVAPPIRKPHPTPATPASKIAPHPGEPTTNAPPTEHTVGAMSPIETGNASAIGNAPAGEPAPLTQARFDAGHLRNPAPPYPPVSRRRGEEGKVVLRVRVSAEGMPEQVEIKTSSGSTRLDEAAQRAVRSWKFIAAKRAGNAVESWVLVPIIFRLEQ